jgi:acyl carrier protein
MRNSEVLGRINELIVEEGGRKVALDDKFMDCDIDSIGLIMFFLELEEQFPIFDAIPGDEDPIESLGLDNMTVRELVHKCRLSLLEQ